MSRPKAAYSVRVVARGRVSRVLVHVLLGRDDR